MLTPWTNQARVPLRPRVPQTFDYSQLRQISYCTNGKHGPRHVRHAESRHGGLIITERPLMIVPRAIPSSGNYSENFTREQVRQAHISEWEVYLQKCYSRMEPDKKAAFDSLWNSHTEDGSGPIFGIIRTNAYSIGNLDPDSKDDNFAYSAILDKMSRINHR